MLLLLLLPPPAFSLLAVLLLTTLAVASKIPFAAPNAAVKWVPSTASQDTCAGSSYGLSNHTPVANWEQCAALYSALPTYDGAFIIQLAVGRGNASTHQASQAQSPFVPLLNAFNCTLGVQPVSVSSAGKSEPLVVAVGLNDLSQVLNNSLSSYSDGMELAVTGQMDCATDPGGVAKLRWLIWDSPA